MKHALRRGRGCGTWADTMPIAFGVVIVLVLVVLAAVGCGSNPTGGTTAPVTGSVGTGTQTTSRREVSTSKSPSLPPDAPAGSASTSIIPSGSLTGAGPANPEPVISEWAMAFRKLHPDVTISYQVVPSAEGTTQFTERTVDFGATNIFMTDEEISAAEQASGAEVLHIPGFLDAVVIAHTLPGISKLRLDPATLAAIFLGSITAWDDPRIAALNPGLTLPSLDITVVHRSDPSFTTFRFTSYLSLASEEWNNKVGSGRTVNWPVGTGVRDNAALDLFGNMRGTIGYVEFGAALQNDLPVVELKNESGNFVAPTLASVAAAAQGTQFPTDLRLSLFDSVNPQAYSIVTATWILAHDPMEDAAKAGLLKTFLKWALSPAGDALVEEVGFVPLADDLRSAALAKISQIGS